MRIVPVRQSHTGIPRCDLARIVILHHSIEKRQIGKTVDRDSRAVPLGIGIEIDPHDIALRRKCQRSGIEGVIISICFGVTDAELTVGETESEITLRKYRRVKIISARVAEERIEYVYIVL